MRINNVAKVNLALMKKVYQKNPQNYPNATKLFSSKSTFDIATNLFRKEESYFVVSKIFNAFNDYKYLLSKESRNTDVLADILDGIEEGAYVIMRVFN